MRARQWPNAGHARSAVPTHAACMAVAGAPPYGRTAPALRAGDAAPGALLLVTRGGGARNRAQSAAPRRCLPRIAKPQRAQGSRAQRKARRTYTLSAHRSVDFRERYSARDATGTVNAGPMLSRRSGPAVMGRRALIRSASQPGEQHVSLPARGGRRSAMSVSMDAGNETASSVARAREEMQRLSASTDAALIVQCLKKHANGAPELKPVWLALQQQLRRVAGLTDGKPAREPEPEPEPAPEPQRRLTLAEVLQRADETLEHAEKSSNLLGAERTAGGGGISNTTTTDNMPHTCVAGTTDQQTGPSGFRQRQRRAEAQFRKRKERATLAQLKRDEAHEEAPETVWLRGLRSDASGDSPEQPALTAHQRVEPQRSSSPTREQLKQRLQAAEDLIAALTGGAPVSTAGAAADSSRQGQNSDRARPLRPPPRPDPLARDPELAQWDEEQRKWENEMIAEVEAARRREREVRQQLLEAQKVEHELRYELVKLARRVPIDPSRHPAQPLTSAASNRLEEWTSTAQSPVATGATMKLELSAEAGVDSTIGRMCRSDSWATQQGNPPLEEGQETATPPHSNHLLSSLSRASFVLKDAQAELLSALDSISTAPMDMSELSAHFGSEREEMQTP